MGAASPSPNTAAGNLGGRIKQHDNGRPSVLREQRMKLLEDQGFLQSHGRLAQFIYTKNAPYIHEQQKQKEEEILLAKLAELQKMRKNKNNKNTKQETEYEYEDDTSYDTSSSSLNKNKKSTQNKNKEFVEPQFMRENPAPINNQNAKFTNKLKDTLSSRLIQQQQQAQQKAFQIGGVYGQKVVGMPARVFDIKSATNDAQETLKKENVKIQENPAAVSSPKQPLRKPQKQQQKEQEPDYVDENNQFEADSVPMRNRSPMRNRPSIRQQEVEQEQKIQENYEEEANDVQNERINQEAPKFKPTNRVRGKKNTFYRNY